MRRFGVIIFGLASFAWASGAQAQLLRVPPDAGAGVAGYGTSCLSPNDDGSSNPIGLGAAFPGGLRFFGRIHDAMFVNTNGNVTFSAPFPTYTPAEFPIADQPMIAPYWADVDIRPFLDSMVPCGGLPSGYSPGYFDCENPLQNGVWWHLEPGSMLVTWDRTGYYGCHGDKRMSFQLLIRQDAATMSLGDFDVQFIYARCEWEVGDASGGTDGFCHGAVPPSCTPAQAGFDAGDLRNYVMLPGSRMDGIAATLCTGSNAGTPGVWSFSVRDGVIICPDAGELCAASALGVCGEGRTRCDGGGTTCDVVAHPSPETCDGRDEDCNGVVDDGTALCAADLVCDHGACMPPCPGRTCGSGETCRAGRCIDACTDVVCSVGHRCVAGACVDECAGVTCDEERTCIHGTCVDRCDGVMCATGEECRRGACIRPLPISDRPDGGVAYDGGVDASLCADSLCYRSPWGCCSVAGARDHSPQGAALVLGLAVLVATRRLRRRRARL